MSGYEAAGTAKRLSETPAGNDVVSLEGDRRRFLLVTVCSEKTALDGTLEKMLGSLPEQGVEYRLYLRCHAVSKDRIAALSRDDRIARVFDIPRVRPLSEARNDILRHVLLDAGPDDIICFPDDDCWFAPNTLATVRKLLPAGSGIDFVVGMTSESPDPTRACEDIEVSTPKLCLHRSSSATLFVRADIIRRMAAAEGFVFDERFGLGTRLGCAEDPDFLIRVCVSGAVGRHARNLQIGHPVKPWRPAQYWKGGIPLLMKHRRNIPKPWQLYRSQIKRGLKFLLAGDISMGTFVEGVYLGCRAFFWSSPARGGSPLE